MDFVLWVSRLMHVVSAVVWIGGLVFINVVLHPMLEHEGMTQSGFSRGVRRRFFPFVWFSLWTMLTTGVLLMLLHPRFIWFDVSSLWSKLLTVKQLSFLLLIFVSWQTARVREKLEQVGDREDEFAGWHEGYQRLVRRSIGLGLISLLCAAGMAVV